MTSLANRFFKVTVAPPPPPSSSSSSLPSSQKLRMVTWNVWFGQKKMDQRLEALVEILNKTDADVIALQEVVPVFAEALRCLVTTSKPQADIPNSPSVWQKYAISKNSIQNYGCLLLVKKSLSPKFKEIEMPTRMGRTLITASIHGGTSSTKFQFNVGTSHFESLNSAEIRSKQLTIAHQTLNASSSVQAVLMGDFNFDSSQEYGDWLKSTPTNPGKLENTVVFKAAGMQSWVDAWCAVHPHDKGFTFDGEINSNIRNKLERMRYDRVMVSPGKWNAVTASLLGTKSIDQTINTCPSDHFGVCVDIERST